MNENKFYEILRDFLQKNKISLPSNIESIKKEWIPFLNITEISPQHCICGHKVKHITYLFNIVNKTIIFIGTSCCKKYGLLETHMKNDILVNVLKNEILHSSFTKDENIVYFTKPISLFIEEYIFENFKLYTTKYRKTMDMNNYFFDVFRPLKKLESSVLELIETYDYDLTIYYDELVLFLKEIEMNQTENIDLETNSEIMEHLETIENEIYKLLNENDYCIETIKMDNLGTERNQQSNTENFIELEKEKEIEYNLKIEETIQKEYQEEKECQEKEALFYTQVDDNHIIECYESSETDVIVMNNYQYKYRNIKLFDEVRMNHKMKMKLLDYNIELLRNDMNHLRNDIENFSKKVHNFKNNVFEFGLLVNSLR